MSSMEPFGTFPTPYGVEVPVFRPKVIDPADPDVAHFSMEATAICAGIYDKAARDRFVADANRLKHCPNIAEYGGHTLPKMEIPPPSGQAYLGIVASSSDTPIEAWITGAMDRFRWSDRADFLLDIIGQNMERVGPADRPFEGVYAFGIAILLTGVLEHLGETEIDCVEAAAFYALSTDEGYAKAGMDWLRPFSGTWFRDWSTARPRYQRLVQALHEPMKLPDWLLASEGGTP